MCDAKQVTSQEVCFLLLLLVWGEIIRLGLFTILGIRLLGAPYQVEKNPINLGWMQLLVISGSSASSNMSSTCTEMDGWFLPFILLI